MYHRHKLLDPISVTYVSTIRPSSEKSYQIFEVIKILTIHSVTTPAWKGLNHGFYKPGYKTLQYINV
jgi:hypothetical protein